MSRAGILTKGLGMAGANAAAARTDAQQGGYAKEAGIVQQGTQMLDKIHKGLTTAGATASDIDKANRESNDAMHQQTMALTTAALMALL